MDTKLLINVQVCAAAAAFQPPSSQGELGTSDRSLPQGRVPFLTGKRSPLEGGGGPLASGPRLEPGEPGQRLLGGRAPVRLRARYVTQRALLLSLSAAPGRSRLSGAAGSAPPRRAP